jgi:hypothetical protein
MKLKLEITEKELTEGWDKYNENSYVKMVGDYPIYASVGNLTRREILILGKLFQYDLDSVDEISISFVE